MAAKKKAKGAPKKSAKVSKPAVKDSRPLWDVDVVRLVKVRVRQRVRANDKFEAKSRALAVTLAADLGYVIPADSREEVGEIEGALKLVSGEEAEGFECDLGEDDDAVAEVRLVSSGG